MHDRITFRIPKQQLEELEQLVENGVYPSRSEAIRAAVRDLTTERSTYEHNHAERRTPAPTN